MVQKPTLKKGKTHGMDRTKNILDGLPIVNATKSLKLEITTADIKHSQKKSAGFCAAAVACVRQLKAKEARVHLSRTYIRHNGKWIRYITPTSLQKEIIAFDRGGSFEPGHYRLMKVPPGKLIRVGEPSGGKGNKKKKLAARAPMQFVANVRNQVFRHD